jgi:hypothetical protein
MQLIRNSGSAPGGNIKGVLDEAVAKGIISREQAEQIEPLMGERQRFASGEGGTARLGGIPPGRIRPGGN